jgi:DNA-directed RNA polymerase subunit M
LVEFCDKCGFILLPINKRSNRKIYIDLYCNNCKTIQKKTIGESSYKVSTKIPHGIKDYSVIINDEFYTDPIIRVNCPKCGYHEAFYWESSNRRKQEWESVTYYRCIKCKNTWDN